MLFFAVTKVISQVIVTLKCRTNNFQDLYGPSINQNHHYITSIRLQGEHQVLVAHAAHFGALITISVPLITGMSPDHRSI